jgi:hypothetical protein
VSFETGVTSKMKPETRKSPQYSSVKVYETLQDLNRKSPRFDQGYALGRLIWYLDSGGRRSYVVVERPDEAERNLPRPDYVCRDMHTGTCVTVEVTKIFHNPQVGKIEEFRKDLCYEIAKRVDGQLPGTFILCLPARLLINQNERARIIDSTAAQVTEIAPSLEVFESRPLGHHFSLCKMSDDGTALLGPAVNDSENDPALMMDWSQVVEAIEKPLAEAHRKLSAYAQGMRAVILDCQF